MPRKRRKKSEVYHQWNSEEEYRWAKIQSTVGKFHDDLNEHERVIGQSPTRFLRRTFRDYFSLMPPKSWSNEALRKAIAYRIMLNEAQKRGMVEYGNKLFRAQKYNQKSLEERYFTALEALPGFLQEAQKHIS